MAENKMRDIFENALVCDECDRKTERGVIEKDGFQLRYWKCPSCEKQWLHPADAKEYEDFCMCKSHNGKPPSYLCTRAIGHSGPHVAHGSENIVCAIWR